VLATFDKSSVVAVAVVISRVVGIDEVVVGLMRGGKFGLVVDVSCMCFWGTGEFGRVLVVDGKCC
jgi:hypothetical protein